MLDREIVEKGADVLSTAIAALFEEGIEASATAPDATKNLGARLIEIRQVTDDVAVLVAALVVLLRRLQAE